MKRAQWALLFFLAACGGEIVEEGEEPDDLTQEEEAQLSSALGQAPTTYTNPVLDLNCPDPGVIRDDARYFMTCTGGHFPIFSSPNLVGWNYRGELLPTFPSWSTGGAYWAPEIHRIGNTFVAYFTANSTIKNQISIGAAVATRPIGPYTDRGAPLVSNLHVGMIDPHEFTDPVPDANGVTHRYLFWKEEGNAHGNPTPLYVRELTADGLHFIGPRRVTISNTLPWEGRLIEGPFVVRRGSWYYLFYSGNSFMNATYAVGVARSKNPMGPYVKKGDPILRSNDQWTGPGHNSVVQTPSGKWFIVYHAWHNDFWLRQQKGRVVLLDRLRWQSAWPFVTGGTPSTSPQPFPD